MRYVPNLLCLLRIVLAPCVAWAVVALRYDWALGMLIVAAWSDFFDGFLARKYAVGTPFGTALDPVADKILMATTYLALGYTGGLPAWLVCLVFLRDLAILLAAALLFRFRGIRHFPPTMLGKWSTTFQILAGLFALVHRPYPWVWLAAAGTVVSWADYGRRAVATLQRSRTTEPA